MSNLIDIEQQTKKFADAHNQLSDIVRELTAEIERAKCKRLTEIKNAVALCAERRAKLSALIEGSPDLFIRPRTVIFHAVKVGFQKQKGGISFQDAEQVVKRVHQIYGPQAADYLHISEKPDRAALDKLTVCELKRLGCEVLADSDSVIIKPTDSEVEKIVTALLKESAEEKL